VVSFCNFIGSCVGLYLADRIGRRKLTLHSIFWVSICLFGIGVCFYYAEHTSQEIDSSFSDVSDQGKCGDYKYCFDCIQNDDCGFCSTATVISPVSSSSSSSFSLLSNQSITYYYNVCIKGDSDNPTNRGLCDDAHYYGESCPDSSFAGWLIFTGLCLYLFAFAPGT
jgi:hypothetical protein